MDKTIDGLSKPQNYLINTLNCKCPRCRQGKLFVKTNPYSKNNLKMNPECPVCGQPSEIEMGFYTGAAYVAYALTIAVATAVFVAWYVLIGFTMQVGDNRIFYCLATSVLALVITAPILMRISRSMWLSFFVKYDPEWRTNKPDNYERVNPIGMEANHE